MSKKCFCSYCGEEKKEVLSDAGVEIDGKFWPKRNIDTGKRETMEVCVNMNCPKGKTTGCNHSFKGILNKKCKYCGKGEPMGYH